MAREQGTFEFAANFERKKEGAIDATTLVDQFSDLLNFTEDNYIPLGHTVTVKNTTTYNGTQYIRGIYICVDKNNLNQESSWELVGNTTGNTNVNDKNFIYNQNMPNSQWTINHNLNKYPSVTVIDSSGNKVIGDVEYIGTNNLIITFSSPFGGTAVLN